ncbi:hypothetical protein ATANTOWER_020615, partial [Ataeniobius toweri]|nr:hypothetical protein [Ataeniobius toweri]
PHCCLDSFQQIPDLKCQIPKVLVPDSNTARRCDIKQAPFLKRKVDVIKWVQTSQLCKRNNKHSKSLFEKGTSWKDEENTVYHSSLNSLMMLLCAGAAEANVEAAGCGAEQKRDSRGIREDALCSNPVLLLRCRFGI